LTKREPWVERTFRAAEGGGGGLGMGMGMGRQGNQEGERAAPRHQTLLVRRRLALVGPSAR
jgi:hypothetical protein